MKELKSFQKKYLRGLAHSLKPVVSVGQKGITDTLIGSINEALNAHELIKIKFQDFKEKSQKKALLEIMRQKTQSQVVGLIGHAAILFREHPDPEKRKIVLPRK
ncbi:MAG: ribosome assembly RNA-binding protein YhbY [Desulfatiglans sp.]|jgi:RNA-binding protein|nr:ribosome assembly RNA-binding protein YhbY [Thermodesulfobacteriota bacterium]MEE4352267.1 ribosome assembly RNA-binding protein YhbY [Desulfatiglans sp.]